MTETCDFPLGDTEHRCSLLRWHRGDTHETQTTGARISWKDHDAPPAAEGGEVAKLLAEYDDWAEDRKVLSRREAGEPEPGDDPEVPGDEWHGSDDSGIDLLHRMAEVLR